MKKIFLIFAAIFLVNIAFCQPQKNSQMITLEGTLIKKPWSKSIESYCAQGSDYFVLETGEQTVVLAISDSLLPICEKFNTLQVIISGQFEKKVIKPSQNPYEQRPVTFGDNDGFECTIFRVEKIRKKD